MPGCSHLSWNLNMSKFLYVSLFSPLALIVNSLAPSWDHHFAWFFRCRSDGNGCRIGQSGGRGQSCGTDGNWRCQPSLGLNQPTRYCLVVLRRIIWGVTISYASIICFRSEITGRLITLGKINERFWTLNIRSYTGIVYLAVCIGAIVKIIKVSHIGF